MDSYWVVFPKIEYFSKHYAYNEDLFMRSKVQYNNYEQHNVLSNIVNTNYWKKLTFTVIVNRNSQKMVERLKYYAQYSE